MLSRLSDWRGSSQELILWVHLNVSVKVPFNSHLPSPTLFFAPPPYHLHLFPAWQRKSWAAHCLSRTCFKPSCGETDGREHVCVWSGGELPCPSQNKVSIGLRGCGRSLLSQGRSAFFSPPPGFTNVVIEVPLKGKVLGTGVHLPHPPWYTTHSM